MPPGLPTPPPESEAPRRPTPSYDGFDVEALSLGVGCGGTRVRSSTAVRRVAASPPAILHAPADTKCDSGLNAL